VAPRHFNPLSLVIFSQPSFRALSQSSPRFPQTLFPSSPVLSLPDYQS